MLNPNDAPQVSAHPLGQSDEAMDAMEAQLQQELRSMFEVDTQKGLQTFLDQAPRLHPQTWSKDIQTLYRTIHTIKGGSVTVGADAILQVATVLEDLLSDLRHLETAPSLQDGTLAEILVEAGELLASTISIEAQGETARAQVEPSVQRIQTLRSQIQQRYLPQWSEQKQLQQEFAQQGLDLVVLDLEIALENLPQQAKLPENILQTARNITDQLYQIGQDLQLSSGWETLLRQAETLMGEPDARLWHTQWPRLFQALKTCARGGGSSVPFELVFPEKTLEKESQALSEGGAKSETAALHPPLPRELFSEAPETELFDVFADVGSFLSETLGDDILELEETPITKLAAVDSQTGVEIASAELADTLLTDALAENPLAQDPSAEDPLTGDSLVEDVFTDVGAFLSETLTDDVLEPEGFLEPQGFLESQGVVETEEVLEPEGRLAPESVLELESFPKPEGVLEPGVTATDNPIETQLDHPSDASDSELTGIDTFLNGLEALGDPLESSTVWWDVDASEVPEEAVEAEGDGTLTPEVDNWVADLLADALDVDDAFEALDINDAFETLDVEGRGIAPALDIPATPAAIDLLADALTAADESTAPDPSALTPEPLASKSLEPESLSSKPLTSKSPEPAAPAPAAAVEPAEQIQIPVPLEKLDQSAQDLISTLLSVRSTQGYSQVLQNQIVQLVSLAQEGVQHITHLRQIQDDYALMNNLEPNLRESGPTPERYRQGYTAINRLLETSLRLSELGAEAEKTAKQMTESLQLLDNRVLKLQATVEESRLVPFRNLAFRARAILRELTTRFKKPAKLVVQGELTELDVGTARSLEPALLHLVRNAFDHALEPPEERKTRGKPEQGVLTLSLQRRGNTYRLDVQDDGRGINPEAIRARALALELPLNNTSNQSDLLAVICQPGFSSETEVSDISGRGVGMDVVAAQIVKLGGKLTLDTSLGEGTTFHLQFPVPHLLLPCVMLQAGDRTFAIPNEDIKTLALLESLRATPIQEPNGLYSWQIEMDDEAIPGLDLIEYWQPQRVSRSLEETTVCAYIQSPTANRGAWLMADDLLGQFDLLFDPLPAPLRSPEGIMGVSLQPDGTLVPVIDGAAIVEWLYRAPQESSSDLSDTADPTVQDTLAYSPTILIVDDAALMRRRLEVSLTAYGHLTHTCADGLEAWKWLKVNPNPALIITDIEMPNMDGFTLIDRCRQENIQVPILVVSSRLSEEWFDEAKRLGANDYLTKGFSTLELVNKVNQLMALKV